MLDLKTADWRM